MLDAVVDDQKINNIPDMEDEDNRLIFIADDELSQIYYCYDDATCFSDGNQFIYLKTLEVVK